MTIQDDIHECHDKAARKAIRDARDEHATALGQIMGEMGDINGKLEHLREFLGASAYKRRHGLNGHSPPPPERETLPSFPELVDDITGSHQRPGSWWPRAVTWLDTKIGRAVRWCVTFVIGIVATLAMEHWLAPWVGRLLGH